MVLPGVVEATLTHRHHLQAGGRHQSPQLSPPFWRHLAGEVWVTAQCDADPLVCGRVSQEFGDLLSSLARAPLVWITEVDDATSELLSQVLPIQIHAVRQTGDGGLSPAEELQVTVRVEH